MPAPFQHLVLQAATQARLIARQFKWRRQQQPWLLGRLACMGQDVLARLDLGLPLLNVQKGRVDLLLQLQQTPRLRPRTPQVASHLARLDVLPLVSQQQSILSCLPRTPPCAVLFDSFSELTDQLFVHRKDDWRFCCHYSDLNHTPQFTADYRCDGLLDCEFLTRTYDAFFHSLRERYGDVPIVYLHFPVKLDTRELFHRRHAAILQAVQTIASGFPRFHSVSVNDAVVDWPRMCPPDLRGFPYHYNSETYDALTNAVWSTGVFRPIAKAA